MTEERKPVNCGCGGEAYPRSYVNTFHVTEDGYDHTVYCNKCNIETKMYDTESEAVTAWNRAMRGNAEEKLKAFWDGMSAEMREERTIIRCVDCKWWDQLEDGHPYGNCRACRSGTQTERWDIHIQRQCRMDFYCADAEPKGEDDEDAG